MNQADRDDKGISRRRFVQQGKYDYPFDAVYHPWNFRGWWDFGTGALGDMGCHHFNTLPPRTLPRRRFKDLTTGEWLAACHGGEPASCNFDVGGLLAEIVVLGNIAIRRGKKLYWDAVNMRFTNDEDANQYLREPYRTGWSL